MTRDDEVTGPPDSVEDVSPIRSAEPTADTGDQLQAQTLVGLSFDDVYRAQEFMSAAAGMGGRGDFKLHDLVFVRKDDDGRTKVVETTDAQGGQRAVSGAVWAGLFGLILGGPVGWVAGTALGAGGGAAAAKLIDTGISDEWISWFREAVQPGTATVVLLITDYDEDALVREAERYSGSRLIYANVDDDLLDRLHVALRDR